MTQEDLFNSSTVSPGFISGGAVIRDKDGNIKSKFTFGGPTDMTEEEFKSNFDIPEEKL